MDFDGCLALTCLCDTSFCGWCLKKCDPRMPLGEAHMHVRRCPENRMDNDDVFAPLELWKRHHKQRREKKIYDAIGGFDTEQRLLVLGMIKKELEDNELDVCEQDWDPLCIFNGRWEFHELTKDQKNAVETLGFRESWPVIPGYWMGWPFPTEKDDPEAMRAWQDLGFSRRSWPIGKQAKDEMLIKEVPSFLDAERTLQFRIYYTKYWLTMVTGIEQPGVRIDAPARRIRGRARHLDWGDIPDLDEEVG